MENKKSNSGLWFMVVILILCTFCLGGYIIYDKTLSNESKINDNTNNKNNDVKIDSSKDYVYDAEYTYKSQYDLSSYKAQDMSSVTNNILIGETNIMVPYFNINNNDAEQANSKMKNLFDENMKSVEKYFSETEGISGAPFLNYKIYNSEDFISVIIVNGYIYRTQPYPKYYGYVFNKNTGELLNTSNIAKEKGLTIEELEEKTKSSIKEFAEENDRQNKLKGFEGIYTGHLNETYSMLHNNINNQGIVIPTIQLTSFDNIAAEQNGVIYFFDENNNLKVLLTILEEQQYGSYIYLLDI